MSDGGGAAARRAVARWAWRLFKREWHQQLLVLSLITVAVAAAVGSVSAAYNVPASPAARLGSARQSVAFDGSDPALLQSQLSSAEQFFGAVDVIGRRHVPIPGSVESLELRAQDLHGQFGASMLGLRDGRFPARPDEVATTDGVAAALGLHIGDTLPVDDRQLAVVGVVENPFDLDDEFALVSPSTSEKLEFVTVLVSASSEQFDAFRALRTATTFEVRGDGASTNAATAMLAVSTLLLLLVALIAAAGFAVVAQRRLRQIGMLAAMGATDRHLRLVLIVHGAVVGAMATVTGTIIGLAAWVGLAPRLEAGAGHRIDPFHLPVLLLLGSVAAGLVVPIAAAWWPAHSATRIPITQALSERPPTPRRAEHSALVAVLLIVAGVACLGLADQANPPLLIAGMVATVFGILLISPLAIRLLAGAAHRTPIATRVALRDLGRYQARAGAALAAISLALGIPIAVVITASAADRAAAQSAGQGNLAATQLLFRIGAAPGLVPDTTPAQLATMRTAIDEFTSTLHQPSVTALDMAIDPATGAFPAASGRAGRPVVELGTQRRTTDSRKTFRSIPLYVARPELLSLYGIDPSTIAPDIEVITPEAGDVEYVNVSKRGVVPAVKVIDLSAFSSLPHSFITETGLRRQAWVSTPVGWLIESSGPLTEAQLTAGREMAANAGLTVEARHGPTSRSTIRTAATAAGALLALTILAMTVGTIRGESSSELRTLTATGASSGIRRTLTATTAGALALAGVILGTIGAYLGLAGAYIHDLASLSDIPILNLATAIIGVPLLGVAVGWCLGGREPATFSRRTLT